MIHRNIIIILIFFFSSQIIFCQNNKDDEEKKVLGPAKAAFYSAVLPGLGQVYNKKYWKVPIVYGALAAGIYYYNHNNHLYHDYRDAYKRRLAGFTDDEFYGDGPVPAISNDGLIRAQKSLKRNKELSILVTIGIYALNIIDANVDAHLLQYNLDENLTLGPELNYNEITSTSNVSLSLKLKL
jgi:hypothetical protein